MGKWKDRCQILIAKIKKELEVSDAIQPKTLDCPYCKHTYSNVEEYISSNKSWGTLFCVFCKREFTWARKLASRYETYEINERD